MPIPTDSEDPFDALLKKPRQQIDMTRGNPLNWPDSMKRTMPDAVKVAAGIQQQNDILDRAMATHLAQQAKAKEAEARRVATEQERATKAAEAKAKKEANTARETEFRTKGVQMFTDANGDIRPVTDENGAPRFYAKKGPVEYPNGDAIQTVRDETGKTTTQDLDKNAKIGAAPNAMGRVFRQDKQSPWNDLGSVEDAMQSGDPAIREAAQKAKDDAAKIQHAAAKKGFEARKNEVAYMQAEAAKVAEYATKKADAIKDSIDSTIPAAEQRGFLGAPTSFAREARAKIDALKTEKAQIEADPNLNELEYNKMWITGWELPGTGDPSERSTKLKKRLAEVGGEIDAASLPPDKKQFDEMRSRVQNDADAFDYSVFNNGIEGATHELARGEIAAQRDPNAHPVVKSVQDARKKAGLAPIDFAAKDREQEQQLRNSPFYGPVMEKRDAITSEATKSKEDIFNLRQAAESGDQKAIAAHDEAVAKHNERFGESGSAWSDLQMQEDAANELARVDHEVKREKAAKVMAEIPKLAARKNRASDAEIEKRIAFYMQPDEDGQRMSRKEATEMWKKDQADQSAWYKEKVAKAAQESGFSPEKIEAMADDHNLLSGDLGGKAHVLKFDGRVAVDPVLSVDPKKWDAAIDATNATPEAKAKAKSERESVRDKGAGEALYKALLASDDFTKWATARFEKPKGQVVEEYFKSREGTGMIGIQAAIGALKEQSASISKQFYGLGALLFGHDTQFYNQSLGEHMSDATEGTKVFGAMREGMGGAGTAGFLIDTAGSIIPSLATGGVIGMAGRGLVGAGLLSEWAATAATGAAMPFVAGMQTTGGTYADAYEAGISKGMSPDDARSQALMPAFLSGAATAALTKHFSGGLEKMAAEAGKSAAGKAAAKSAFKSYFKAAVNSAVKDELPEETLDQLASGIIESLTYNPNKTPIEILQEAAMAGAQAMIGAGLTSVASHHGERRAQWANDIAQSGAYVEKAQKERERLSSPMLEKMGAFSPPSPAAQELGAADVSTLKAEVEAADAKIDEAQKVADAAQGPEKKAAALNALAEAHQARAKLLMKAIDNDRVELAARQIDAIGSDQPTQEDIQAELDALIQEDAAAQSAPRPPGIDLNAPLRAQTQQARTSRIAALQAQLPTARTKQQIRQSKMIASALVKVAKGTPIDALTAEEKKLLLEKHPNDGLPRVEMVKGPDGTEHPVILATAHSRLRTIAPAAADIIGQTEREIRADILAGKRGAKADSSPTPQAATTPAAPAPAPAGAAVVGNPGSSNTPTTTPAIGQPMRALTQPEISRVNAFRRMLNKQGIPDALADRVARGYVSANPNTVNEPPSAHKDGLMAALEAAGGKTQSAEPDLVKRNEANKNATAALEADDVARLNTAQTDAEKGEYDKALAEMEKSGPLTQQQKVELAKVVEIFTEALKRWNKAFSSITWTKKYEGSGGALSKGSGNLTISIADVFAEDGNGKQLTLDELIANPDRANYIIREEAIHAWMQANISKERAIKLWGEIGQKARDMTADLYHGVGKWRKVAGGLMQEWTGAGWLKMNPYNMFHEFIRFVAEGKIGPKEIGRTEQSSPTLLKRIANILKAARDFFTNVAKKLSAEGVDKDIIAEIEAAAKQCADAMQKIAGDAEASDPYLSQHVARSQQTSNRGGISGVDGRGTTNTGGKGGNPTPQSNPTAGSGGQGKGSGTGANTGSDGKVEAELKARAEKAEAELADRKAKDERAMRRRQMVDASAGRLADFAQVVASVPADKQEEAKALLASAVPGDATYVVIVNQKRHPASYMALPPGIVQTSHLPNEGFRKNPNYGGENTRKYESDPTEQQKVRNIAAEGALDEGSVVTNVKSAADGPPQIAIVISPDGKVAFQTAGGNGREMGINMAGAEDANRVADEWQAQAGTYGFENLPDGYRGYRFLGVFDLRQEAQAKAYQRLVDDLNPAPGVIAGSGQRAEIDARTKISPEALSGVSLDISTSDAVAKLTELMQDADKLGLDRNLMNSILADAPNAQLYVQKLVLASAFHSPALSGFYFDATSFSGSATARGLIKAAASAAIELRANGADAVADSVARTLETITDYIRNGSNVKVAIGKAAEQQEMGEGAKVVQSIATALQGKVVYREQTKNGAMPVDSDATIEGFTELFEDITRAIKAFDPTPDMFGSVDTIEATLERALTANARKVEASAPNSKAAFTDLRGTPITVEVISAPRSKAIYDIRMPRTEDGYRQVLAWRLKPGTVVSINGHIGTVKEVRDDGFFRKQYLHFVELEDGRVWKFIGRSYVGKVASSAKQQVPADPRSEIDTTEDATSSTMVAEAQPRSKRPIADARRMRQLQTQQREEGLTQSEERELELLEKQAGQHFMQFFDEVRKAPAFSSVTSDGQEATRVEQMALLSKAPRASEREASPDVARQISGDDEIARNGGEREFLTASGLRVVRSGGFNRRKYIRDVFPIYRRCYEKIGMQFAHAGQMLGEQTLFDVVYGADNKAIAFAVSKITDYGYKTVASGQNGTDDGKAAWRENLLRYNEEGYYSELSDAPRHVAQKQGVNAVPASDAAIILGKHITPSPDDTDYSRNLKINGVTEPHVKRMFGTPVLWKSKNLSANATEKSSPNLNAQSTTQQQAQPTGVDTGMSLAGSPMDTRTLTRSPMTSGENTSQAGINNDAPRAKRVVADPNQGGFDFGEIAAPEKGGVTESIPSRKENYDTSRQNEGLSVRMGSKTTQPGGSPASSPAPHLGELFEFMAGHRESKRNTRLAGKSQDGGQRSLFDFHGPEGSGPAPDRNDDGRLSGGREGGVPNESGRRTAADQRKRGGGVPRTDSVRRIERPDAPEKRNYVIQRGAELSPRGLISKLRANIEAIRLLKLIESEKRPATQAERDSLVKYSGWGALSQAFDDDKADRIARGEIAQRKETATRYRGLASTNPSYLYYADEARRQEEAASMLESWQSKWGDYHKQISEALTPDEYRRAMNSTINAHYTSPEIITSLWDIATHLGFKGGAVLEPAAGIGHFIGLMPQSLADTTKTHAVELDELSGRITKLLYPETDVQVTGFQSADITDGSIDLAISNVPFANVPVTDTALSAMRGPVDNLHDYFFGKTLTKLRPGGLVVFITSAFTMDKGSAANRKWLAERADLVAAFRFPNDAFKANAGTDVVTDVIILRKKDGNPFSGAKEFTGLADATMPTGGKIRVNQYFAANPSHILGTLADDGSMYGDTKEMTVHSDPNRPVALAIQQAIDALPRDIAGEGSAKAVRTTDALGSTKMGNITLKDGKYWFNGQSEPDEDLNKPKNVERVKAFIAVRNALNTQYDLELSPEATDAQIDANRAELNATYDSFKVRFNDMHATANKSLFSDDPDFFRLVGAEVPEKMQQGAKAVQMALEGKIKQQFVKADVFRKRVLSPRSEPTSADSIEDAYGISLGWRGRVDLPFIAQMLDTTTEQAEKRLVERDIAVRDPQDGMLYSAEQYTAGNVRKKLEVAKASGPTYERNVRLLEAAIPRDVPIEDVKFKIGATWIPAQVYTQFLQSIGISNAPVTYHQPADGGRDYFHIDVKKARISGTAAKEYSTPHMSALEQMDAALNMKRVFVEITDSNKKPDPQATAVATAQAKDAAKKLHAKFRDWALTTPEISAQLATTYNTEVNAFAQRKYDGQHLTFPWASNDFDIFPDKKNVVWRAIQDGRALIAHGVGGGKTILGSAIALELRRLGMAKKPMIVVHNATLEQFADTIAKIAPSARVLVGRKDELAGAKRKEFLMRIAAGDWDAVVIAHSTFGLIQDDPQVEMDHMQAIVDEAMQSLKDSGYDSLEDASKERKDMSVKQRVKMIQSLEEKILAASQRRTDTGLLNFQQLGVDALIVDEIHEFKKMPFSSKLDVKGIDSGMSARGYAMLLRARNIQARNGGKNVFTMTGTPVTNTLGEVWNMVRLVAPDLLREYKVETFDQFVSKFAEIESVSEETPSGDRKMVERLSKVVNLPEWNTFFRLAADVKFGTDMVVKDRPGIEGGKPELVTVERTPGMSAWVDYIRGVLNAYADMSSGKERSEDPRLLAVPVQSYMASRAAAIDIRMVEPRAKDEPGSKANECVNRVMQIYRDTDSYKGAQVIFADSYREVKTSLFAGVIAGRPNIELDPDKDPGTTFNLYEDLKAKFMAQGVPESEIAIISDSKYSNDKAKQALFDSVNEGRVRIVMGSTMKLGTGVNMQRRMKAAHHLEVPWTPAGLEQRDGRVYRQGNIHGEMGENVQLLRYGMKDSLDSALWQKLETKQRFTTLALNGNVVGRELEEASDILTLAEQRAVLSGPYGQETFETESRIKELEASRLGHLATRQQRRDEIERAKKYLVKQRDEDAKSDAALDAARKLGRQIDADGVKVTVNGKAFPTKVELAEAINAALEPSRQGVIAIGNTNPIAGIEANGLPIRIVPTDGKKIENYGGQVVETKTAIEFTLRMPDENSPDFGRVTSAGTLLARLEELSESVKAIEYSRQQNTARLREVSEMGDVGAWPQQAEYDAKTDRLIELRRLEADRLASLKPKKTAQADAPKSKAPVADSGSVQELVTKNIGLAHNIADGFDNIPGSEKDERRAEARRALVRAARSYDPTKGQFSAFAGTVIRNAMRDYSDKQGGYAKRNITTLDAPLGEEGEDTAKDMLAGSGDVWNEAQSEEMRQYVRAAIAALPPQLADVVNSIGQGDSYSEIGARQRISKQGVGKKAIAALRLMRQHLQGRGVRSVGDLIRSKRVIADGPNDEIARLYRIAKSEEPGKRTIGRPDLSLGALNELVMAVDEWRKTNADKQSHKQWEDDAEKMLATDYAGTKARIIAAGLRGDQLSSTEVKAAMQIVVKEVQRAAADPDNAALQSEVQQLVSAYRDARAEQARGLAAGRDPLKSPADRHREFLAKIIYQPPPAVQKKLDEAKTPDEKQKILSEDAKRIARIQKALADMGITFDDIFSGEVELQLKNRKIVENELKAAKGKDADILKVFQDKRSFAVVAAELKVSEAEVKRVVAEAAKRIRDRHFGKFQKGATMSNVIKSAAPIDPAEAEFAKFMDSLGLTEQAPAKNKGGRPKKPKGRPFDINDPVAVVRIARTIQAVDSGALDMAMEWWMNNILSGPATHAANIAGNAVSTAWDMTVQRGAEALVNMAFRRKDAAQLGEAKYLLRGLLPSIQRARQMAEMAWTAEYDFTEHVMLGAPVDLQDIASKVVGRRAIPGTLGRIVRIPGRALMYADSFFKGLIAQMEVGAHAYRIAKAEGLKEGALEARIKELVDQPGSVAWYSAVEKAKELTFQQDLKKWGDTHNPAEAIARAMQDASGTVPPLRFIIPFIRTPFNIMRAGLRKTPLGSIPLAWDVLSYATATGKNWISRISGNQVATNPELPADFVKGFAEQSIAWTILATIWGAVQGDDDDDKKQILITGSSPRTEATRGERELQKRAYGGDYMIRLGGRGGVTFNFSRYEPAATVLGTMTDAVRSMKRKTDSGDKMNALWGYTMAQVESKSFLRGISDMMAATRDSADVKSGIANTFAQALVPNIIRQPLRNLDEYERDAKGGGFWHTLIPSGANAEAKRDVFGHQIEKTGNGASRMLVTPATKTEPTLQPADRLLLRWNTQNPNEKYAPQTPSRTYRDPKTGKDVEMSAAQYADYTRRAGSLAKTMLAGKITEQQINRPTEKDVDAIKQAFTDARRTVREQMFGKKKTMVDIMWK